MFLGYPDQTYIESVLFVFWGVPGGWIFLSVTHPAGASFSFIYEIFYVLVVHGALPVPCGFCGGSPPLRGVHILYIYLEFSRFVVRQEAT